jgi:hypothetical protein
MDTKVLCLGTAAEFPLEQLMWNLNLEYIAWAYISTFKVDYMNRDVFFFSIQAQLPRFLSP